MYAATDPREIITESSFRVSPDLLGTPLARPWRRFIAIHIDLLLAAILAGLISEPGGFFGVVAAVIVYRVSRPRSGTGRIRRLLLRTLQLCLTAVAFGLAFSLWGTLRSWGTESPPPSGNRIQVEMGLLDAGLSLGDVTALLKAETESEARAAAERVRARMIDNGVTAEELAKIARAFHDMDVRESPLSPIALAGVRKAFAHDLEIMLPPSDPALDARADSLALAYAAALRARDTTTARAIRPDLVTTLAADTLAVMEWRHDQLRDEIRVLQAEARAAEEKRRGILALIRQTLNDFGLSLGWLVLYFVAFPVLWNGYTPGKRLLGIRIQRLDGGKLGWWPAIERFSGYSVALVTGLAGFVQIFWDRNRQCIQDKIAMTVVIYEGRRRTEPQQVAEVVEEEPSEALPEEAGTEPTQVEAESAT